MIFSRSLSRDLTGDWTPITGLGYLPVVGTRRMIDSVEPPYLSRTWFARRALWSFNRAFCRAYHQLRVVNPIRLPRHGAAILVCNHISGLDPLLIQSASPRTITWMMAREYYELGMLGAVFRSIEAIPVDRSGRDVAATRAAMRALADGKVLGIFPEGRIEPTRELLPFQTGVALMAIKTQTPVFPTYLDGTMRGLEIGRAIGEAQRAVLNFGPAVDLGNSSKKDLEGATANIRRAVARLALWDENRPVS